MLDKRTHLANRNLSVQGTNKLLDLLVIKKGCGLSQSQHEAARFKDSLDIVLEPLHLLFLQAQEYYRGNSSLDAILFGV